MSKVDQNTLYLYTANLRYITKIWQQMYAAWWFNRQCRSERKSSFHSPLMKFDMMATAGWWYRLPRASSHNWKKVWSLVSDRRISALLCESRTQPAFDTMGRHHRDHVHLLWTPCQSHRGCDQIEAGGQRGQKFGCFRRHNGRSLFILSFT